MAKSRLVLCWLLTLVSMSCAEIGQAIVAAQQQPDQQQEPPQQQQPQQSPDEHAKHVIEAAREDSPAGQELRLRMECENSIALAEETSRQVRQSSDVEKDWGQANQLWTSASQRCGAYFTPGNQLMAQMVAGALALQKQQAQQFECLRAKGALEGAVRDAERPEEINEQADVVLKSNKAEVVRVQLEQLISPCSPEEQAALRKRIDQVVAKKDVEVKAAVAKFEELERTRKAAAAQKAQPVPAATASKRQPERQRILVSNAGAGPFAAKLAAARQRLPPLLMESEGLLIYRLGRPIQGADVTYQVVKTQPAAWKFFIEPKARLSSDAFGARLLCQDGDTELYKVDAGPLAGAYMLYASRGILVTVASRAFIEAKLPAWKGVCPGKF